jgi:hypothetical protein
LEGVLKAVLCRREEFLYVLKAGPAARQRHDGHRGTGLTVTAAGTDTAL